MLAAFQADQHHWSNSTSSDGEVDENRFLLLINGTDDGIDNRVSRVSAAVALPVGDARGILDATLGEKANEAIAVVAAALLGVVEVAGTQVVADLIGIGDLAIGVFLESVVDATVPSVEVAAGGVGGEVAMAVVYLLGVFDLAAGIDFVEIGAVPPVVAADAGVVDAAVAVAVANEGGIGYLAL